MRSLRTRWLLIAAVAVVVLAAGIVTTVLTRAGASDSAAQSCDLPETAPAAAAAPASAAPGGGGVTVVESAWSPTASDAGASVAAVVQNTSSDHVAYRTQVTFAVTTSDGRNALHPDATKGMTVEIPVLLPGQRIGVATWGGLAVNELGETATTPAKMDVTVGRTHWLNRDAGRNLRKVTAAYKGIVRTDPETSTRATANVLVSSPYCRDVARHGVALLFRDSTGKLIGGTRIADGIYSECRTGTRTDSDSRRDIQGVPETADLARTEAYPYCDPTKTDLTPPGDVGNNYQYS